MKSLKNYKEEKLMNIYIYERRLSKHNFLGGYYG